VEILSAVLLQLALKSFVARIRPWNCWMPPGVTPLLLCVGLCISPITQGDVLWSMVEGMLFFGLLLCAL
jgi:hypothetical protein